MGVPKSKWTSAEEEALRAGIAKYGPGKWRNIKADPQFTHILISRSNIDLKDKWRNMSESRILKSKPREDAPATPLLLTQASASFNPAANDAPANAIGGYSKHSVDKKTASKYDTMILEALSSLKDPNGSGTDAIISFIEQKHELAHNFRSLLNSRLRKLVEQGKLEKEVKDMPKKRNLFFKVQNCYRIKKDIIGGVEVSTARLKELQPKTFTSPVQEATEYAARAIADAERKLLAAVDAKKEEERVSQMLDDATAALEFVRGLYEKCSREEMLWVVRI
ncbi:single myb histone 3-like isoform X1 [Apium graveolens]|uniref:single myb histone 3-like isoform X1 n=1 Tax=Apium graveolens TaxID=4045 RepID=UPI003D7A8AFE